MKLEKMNSLFKPLALPFTAALLGCVVAAQGSSFGLDDVTFWIGSGSQRAVLLIEWKSPEVLNNTEVRPPAIAQTLAWGYRWEGEATAADLFNEVVAADPRLFAVLSEDTGFGAMVLGLGYDLNANQVYGIETPFEAWAYSPLESLTDVRLGVITGSYGMADAAQSMDPADLYWGGVYGPGWELWCEAGSGGGFDAMPDTGTRYWTPDDPLMPWSGTHGQWDYAALGLSGTTLSDGSWIALTIAAGGLDYANPEEPGTIAYNWHKSAPTTRVIAADTSASPYPTEIAEALPPFHRSPLYAEPLAVLGEPTTMAQNLSFFGAPDPFRVKLVEPAYNLDLDGNKTLLTLEEDSGEGGTVYGSVTVKFERPVHDDPANPYGIDFLVFGNTFYVGSGFVSDTTDMRSYYLTGGAFAEPMKVSVSPDGERWYTYEEGPYCDATFPTHGFHWDSELFERTGNGWSKRKMDFTRPVNPVLDSVFGAAGSQLSAAEAIQLYAGSGGGTGFDLAESGFDAIQYIRVEASDGFSSGEIDAFSAVRPALMGEPLSLAPANIGSDPTHGFAELFFQNPARPAETLLKLRFSELNRTALVSPEILRSDEEALRSLPVEPLQAIGLDVKALGGLEDLKLQFNAELLLNCASLYGGSGADLELWSYEEGAWQSKPFHFNPANGELSLSEVTGSLMLALARMETPALAVTVSGGKLLFSFRPLPGRLHILERASELGQEAGWESISSFVAEDSTPVTLEEQLETAAKAFFYRLRISQE